MAYFFWATLYIFVKVSASVNDYFIQYVKSRALEALCDDALYKSDIHVCAEMGFVMWSTDHVWPLEYLLCILLL